MLQNFPNELLFIMNIVVAFGLALLVFQKFGKYGLIVWSVFASIFANIEVAKVIPFFGWDITLGNILFGITFFATDVLSECYGKKDAQRCIWMTLAMQAIFVVLMQFSLAYTPSSFDFAAEPMKTLFGLAPRICIASLVLYFLASRLDVFLYHTAWKATGNNKKWLWMRNNLSTMTAQAVQQVLFMFIAFYGMEGFDAATCLKMGIVNAVVVVFVAFCDTPFLYFARRIFYKKHGEICQNRD